MAKLYFRYGAMGSSKTANAIMVYHNYQERGQNALMLKPKLDTRDGKRFVGSRSGLRAPCFYVEELENLDLTAYNCIIVDEAQFLSKAQVEQLVEIVDDLNIPVICYGLRADFQGNLFEGSQWLLAWADTLEEVKTVCWCGRKATCNARVAGGKVVKSGAQIILGGNESYVSLCRKHWVRGILAPIEIRKITTGKDAYMSLLLEADPSERMINSYLEEGELYALTANGKTASVAVITLRPDGKWELRNLATAPELRDRGYAGQLIRYLLKLYAPRGDRMYVGTDPSMVPFYEKFGFSPVYTVKDFFVDHYEAPIIENGIQLTDMIYLARNL